ncbi:MAG: leucyl/phenylalanyl-tRNA--protein transferase [Spirosomaceae bacterium]|jgi:leucyl/phenylalanyl-tRNA--protein transferase|nr:leucyl/phenylalanyl-tRNA--protein transferase [Spirosomataceae bacterium]
MSILTADDLIYGYMNGIFPMADGDNTLYWYSPDPRAIIPIDTYKSPKSLRPILNKNVFEVRINADFEGVIRGCAAPRSSGDTTWISEEIITAYTELYHLGLAHSVETYRQGRLVGGLYGVSIGAAFFGESMFHTEDNASKVAFHFLMKTLHEQGFELLDTQFINDNVRRFGAIEIAKAEYNKLLKKAISKKARFTESMVEHLFKNHHSSVIE